MSLNKEEDIENKSLVEQEDFMNFHFLEKNSLLSNYNKNNLNQQLEEDLPSEAYDYSHSVFQQNSLMKSYRNANISRQSGRLKIKKNGNEQSMNSFSVSINASELAHKLKEKSGMKSEAQESFLTVGNKEYSKVSNQDVDLDSE